jgi:hypothetical protein
MRSFAFAAAAQIAYATTICCCREGSKKPQPPARRRKPGESFTSKAHAQQHKQGHGEGEAEGKKAAVGGQLNSRRSPRLAQQQEGVPPFSASEAHPVHLPDTSACQGQSKLGAKRRKQQPAVPRVLHDKQEDSPADVPQPLGNI